MKPDDVKFRFESTTTSIAHRVHSPEEWTLDQKNHQYIDVKDLYEIIYSEGLSGDMVASIRLSHPELIVQYVGGPDYSVYMYALEERLLPVVTEIRKAQLEEIEARVSIATMKHKRTFRSLSRWFWSWWFCLILAITGIRHGPFSKDWHILSIFAIAFFAISLSLLMAKIWGMGELSHEIKRIWEGVENE